MRRVESRGFTLIEVMIALTIGALVVAIGYQAFAVLGDHHSRLVGARDRSTRTNNARVWLRALLASTDVTLGTTDGFVGQADRLTFDARVPRVGGWFEPNRVQVGLAGDRVEVSWDEVTFVLAEDVSWLRIDYLASLGADSPWLPDWRSNLSAPRAVRLRVARRVGGGFRTDTLLFRIARRG